MAVSWEAGTVITCTMEASAARQSGAMRRGKEQGRRTDDFLGCVGDELHEVDGWFAAENGLEL